MPKLIPSSAQASPELNSPPCLLQGLQAPGPELQPSKRWAQAWHCSSGPSTLLPGPTREQAPLPPLFLPLVLPAWPNY